MQIPFNIGKLLSLLINLLIILNQILTELPLFFLLWLHLNLFQC